MSRHAMLLALVASVACDDHVVHVPATQILLEVDADPSIKNRTATLVVATFVQHPSQWKVGGKFEQAAHEFPLPFSIVPGEGTALNAKLEIVVRAQDVERNPLTEARRVVNFVRHEERLLRVLLSDCEEVESTRVCETSRNCHEDCLSCEGGQCESAPKLMGQDLPGLFEELAAGDSRETRESIDSDPQPDADAGEPDSQMPDGEMPGHDGELEDAAVPECEETATRCENNAVEHCDDGKWATLQKCEHQTCVAASCQGVCAPEEGRCMGFSNAVPQVCSARGEWAAAEQAAPAGACSLSCDRGRCVDECSAEGMLSCSALNDGQPLLCERGTLHPQPVCSGFCVASVGCVQAPSCSGNPACGAGESCCNARTIPGGVFSRSYDGSMAFPDDSFTARVSPFLLDRFEVTVGRFRKWLDVYDQPGSRPRPGDGRTADPSDRGWLEEWTALLAGNSAELRSLVSSCGTLSSFASTEADHEELPINCIDWYSSLAFCIWDGGRLPTEAEWNFAAAGGEQQRLYPWTLPGTVASIGPQHAVFGESRLARVGSKSPFGDGRFGQADLAGNVEEWVMDIYQDEHYPTTSCDDCVNTSGGVRRVIRGGAWGRPKERLTASYRDGFDPYTTLSEKGGFRCARSM